MYRRSLVSIFAMTALGRPNNEGTDYKNSVNLAGDELKITGMVPSTGIRFDYVYRRAK
jgi:hypothetical protein